MGRPVQTEFWTGLLFFNAGGRIAPVIRIRLELAYDGTDFAGWAMQPNLRTVQGSLEEALERVLRVDTARVTVAGRTDAGVHARKQVAHVDIPITAWEKVPGRSDRSPAVALSDRLNRLLPPDIVVLSAAPAPDGFDARFSALRRSYSYRISDRVTTRDPLRRTSVLWNRSELDASAMNRAAVPLTGLRDFAAFCKPRPGATTIRHLLDFGWQRETQGPDSGIIVGRLQSDAFCHNMVRALVGACLAVGLGKRAENWPLQMLEGQQRDPGILVVPAHGLTLEGVVYPADDDLGSRADRVRARRTSEETVGP